MSNQRKAVVLLSGGLDSTTTLAECLHQGFEAYALTYLYGQKHAIERAAARRVAQAYPVARHLEMEIDLSLFGGSALTSDIAVPKDREHQVMSSEIPITYVPARNTVFLSLALAWAETLEAFDLFIGVNAIDYSGYPDCRPEFLRAFENLAKLATRAGVTSENQFRIHAPLVAMSKDEIIQRGLDLGVDYSVTHSCYEPFENLACGRCDSCQLRLAAFERLGMSDPIPYAPNTSLNQS